MANTNIINAVFGSGACAVTTSAFRANYGMILRFSGIDLPTAFEVDFSNYDVAGHDSITAIGQNGEVQIPDDLWESGLNIYAYVYLHPTDDSGVTVYTVTIPVLGRPNRTEETPTPHEQSVIEQAISALNDAVEQTAADVETTTANAQAAAQAAESVSGLSAQIEQNTADIAELVQSKAGVLIDTASGSIASFVPDATIPTVKGLTVKIEPVQDLHGYDAPWPAGGGKNLFNYENTGITLASMGQSGSVFSNTNTDSRTFFNFQFRALNNGTVVVTSDAQSISSTGRKSATITISETITHVSIVHNGSQRNLSVIYPFTGQGTFTISFDVTAYNPSSVGGLSFKDVQIELGSTATTYAPYSNICPISGWDAVELDRTAINAWDEEWEVGAVNMSNGSERITSNTIRSKNYCELVGGSTYYATCGKTDGGYQNRYYIGIIFYDAEKHYISGGYYNNLTFTAPENARYFKLTTNTSTVVYGNTYNNDISINYPSTDTAYHSGKDNATYQIQLGQTVYGGTLDVINGVLTVDRAMFTFTGAESFIENTAWGAYAKLYNTGVAILSSVTNERTISSHFERSSGGGWGSLTAGLFMTAGGTFIGIGFDGSISELQAYLASQYSAGTPVQVVALLATPITVDLTPIEVAVLTGQTNNVWADSGDVSVEYAADLKTYINNKIAAVVAALS